MTLSSFELDIVVSPDRPRYELPVWLIPGVLRWDPAFREDINRWALTFFRPTNIVADGQVIGGDGLNGRLVMNPRTYAFYLAKTRSAR